MRIYELLYIIPPKFTEKETSKIFDQVEKILKDAGANILESRPFEKKPLAYPINHCHFGIYGLLKFECEKESIQKIDEKIRLMFEIIRYQISKYFETQRPEIDKFKKFAAARQSKKTKKTTAPKIKLPAIDEKEKVEEKKATPPSDGVSVTPRKDDKIKLEELDKKLEEILKE